jgi:hypothetical protein
MASRTEKQALGIKASNEAKHEILSKYKDEFDDLHRQKRVALGLNPVPGSQSLTLDEKIEKLQSQLNDLVKQKEAA